MAIVFSKIEKQGFASGLWIKKLSVKDLNYALSGFAAVIILTSLIIYLTDLLSGMGIFHKLSMQPVFLKTQEDFKYQYNILFIWIPVFILNILGEEFFWRGYLLKRQIAVFGNYAWLVNGSGWTLFHISFGLDMMVMLSPILFILPYVVQKTKNVWTGVIIHGLLNGPAFIALVLGIL